MKKTIQAFLIFVLLILMNACSFNANVNMNYDNRKYHALQNGETFEQVSSISVTWIDGDVSVLTSDEVQWITLYEITLDTYEEHYLAQVAFDEKTRNLDVKYCDSGVEMVKKYGKSLKICIPSGMQIDNLTIYNISGNISLKDIMVKSNVSVSSSTGAITSENVQSQNVTIQKTSGSLYIKLPVSRQNIYISTISGPVILDISVLISGFLIQSEGVSGELKSEFILTDAEQVNQKYYSNAFNEEREIYIYLTEITGNITINQY